MSYDTLPRADIGGLKAETITSHPEFGHGTNGSEVAEAFAENIKGKNIVITGVSPNSLGETLATNVARHSPNVLILASRTLSKLEEVANRVKKTYSDPKLIVVDLGSQRSIRKAAANILHLLDHVDILINNAAVVSSERRETVDGFEQTFAVNHLGHFLLTSLLIARADLPGTTRVVNVTSLGYRLSPFRFHDYYLQGHPVPPEEEPPSGLPAHMEPSLVDNRPYQGFCAYGQSKTANILHCVSLNQKFGGIVRAFAVHPGSIWTDLSRNLSPDDLKIIEGTSTSWINHDQGTATILVAALDPKLSRVDERVFLENCQFTEVADTACDQEIAARLWSLSEQLTRESDAE